MADATLSYTNETTEPTVDPIALTVDIVGAYIANNSLPACDLAGLITSVHNAVAGLASGASAPTAQAAEEIEKPTAAQIRKSVTPDGIISFLDGRTYKTMKRHLGTHGLDPRTYRERYDLPRDYPMVAPNYAAQRSALAKSIGLGVPGGMARSDEAAPTQKERRRKSS